jgi:hypothetical protein
MSRIESVEQLLEMVKNLTKNRASYQDLKPCIESTMLKYVEALAKELQHESETVDMIKGERMVLESACAEKSIELKKVLEIVKDNVEFFERHYEALRHELEKTIKKNGLVNSIKVSRAVHDLIDKLSRELPIKRGLKSRALKRTLDAFMKGDLEKVKQFAEEDAEKLVKKSSRP